MDRNEFLGARQEMEPRGVDDFHVQRLGFHPPSPAASDRGRLGNGVMPIVVSMHFLDSCLVVPSLSRSSPFFEEATSRPPYHRPLLSIPNIKDISQNRCPNAKESY